MAETVRRAFAEFLTIPTVIIVAFLMLGALIYYLDALRIERGWPSVIRGAHDSISTLLGTIATSIITVTSITFSLLLIAVQQGASSLTSQVFDQFLRRRTNQVYFGFFIGLALYCLLILATVRPDYTPIYGAIVAFALTVVALYLLVLLIYSTIDQMRPVVIIQTIRDHTLTARRAQQELLGRTRRDPVAPDSHAVRIPAESSGYLTGIDLDALDCAAHGEIGASEVVLLRSIGDYVSVGEALLEVRFDAPGAATDRSLERLLAALRLEQQRDLATDPGFGIEQLATIGWTSISTSKSNPQPGLLACWSLRDLVAEWFMPAGPDEQAKHAKPALSIVYPDNVPRDLLQAFESLMVVTSESMQHQVLAELYRALALGADRLPLQWRDDLTGIVERSVSALGDHVLTARLRAAIDQLAEELERQGMPTAKLLAARDELAQSAGRLNSRSTRSSQRPG